MFLVVDNFFDERIVSIVAHGVNHYRWAYGHKSDIYDPNHNRFFVINLYDGASEDNLFYMLWRMIQTKVPSLLSCHCWRVIANGQVKGQNGDWHTDHGDKTVLYFPLEWKPQWGGSAHFKINGSESEIEYKRNRVIIFSSDILHYGSCPAVENVLRVSIAFNLRAMQV
jgi:hypothetical protein